MIRPNRFENKIFLIKIFMHWINAIWCYRYYFPIYLRANCIALKPEGSNFKAKSIRQPKDFAMQYNYVRTTDMLYFVVKLFSIKLKNQQSFLFQLIVIFHGLTRIRNWDHFRSTIATSLEQISMLSQFSLLALGSSI